ncbi:hypothetical protein N0V90_011384 [Kalmusia sp. IMI 367209]|nr:hypothetical protein N0V90_011384 [Kalmusia sp. IMI 367209]
MRSLSKYVVLLQSTLHLASAHYSLSVVRINNTLSADWQYVRRTTYTAYPWQDILDPETVRCGWGANTRGNETQTATIRAGGTVGLRVGPSSEGAYEQGLYHAGPAYGYMSRAPADLESYEGDGEWFKIGQYGALKDTRWIVDGDYGPYMEVTKQLAFPREGIDVPDRWTYAARRSSDPAVRATYNISDYEFLGPPVWTG